jgi:hypothetical protein
MQKNFKAKKKLSSSQSWLDNWLTQLKENQQQAATEKKESSPGIRRSSMISESAASQLYKLYESSSDKTVEPEASSSPECK